ncbi:MAG: TRAP transporter small permease [Lachnospiraceae bacterium]|jgi:TRAP-T family tripartite ATP-independent periplasmic transporter, membrane protein|nr:MAG: TRAP transporter small permease [Lachnospiraceae bacterium]
MKKVNEYLEEIILVILLICMTLILGLQIVSRYVFRNSLSWSEELVRYMFVWSTFIGVPYCIKKSTSIKVDQFRNSMPASVQKALSYIDKLIMLILFLIMAAFSCDIVASSFASGQSSAAIGIPSWLIQISVPIGSVLSIIRIIQNAIALSRESKQEKEN